MWSIVEGEWGEGEERSEVAVHKGVRGQLCRVGIGGGSKARFRVSAARHTSGGTTPRPLPLAPQIHTRTPDAKHPSRRGPPSRVIHDPQQKDSTQKDRPAQKDPPRTRPERPTHPEEPTQDPPRRNDVPTASSGTMLSLLPSRRFTVRRAVTLSDGCSSSGLQCGVGVQPGRSSNRSSQASSFPDARGAASDTA